MQCGFKTFLLGNQNMVAKWFSVQFWIERWLGRYIQLFLKGYWTYYTFFMCSAGKWNVDAVKIEFSFDILWLVKVMFFAPWKLGGYQHHLLILNGALLLIIAANTVHVWNYQERILAGNFASIVGKTRRHVCAFFSDWLQRWANNSVFE